MIGEEVIAVYGDAGDGEELFEVQKLVRCGECKYWLDGSGLCKHWSKLYGSVLTKANDFCSFGEREGE